MATAVSKVCWTRGSHDVGNVTFPTITPSSCAKPDVAIKRKTTIGARRLRMGDLRLHGEKELTPKRGGGSHLLEKVRVDARDDERFVLALDLHVRLAAEVAGDGSDR